MVAVALVKSLLPDRKLSLYCGTKYLCTTGPERSLLCGWLLLGVLPCAWIVQLTLPMWIGVCASVTQSFALCNPAKSISCEQLRANAQGAPDEPNGYVQRAGHKGMRWVIY